MKKPKGPPKTSAYHAFLNDFEAVSKRLEPVHVAVDCLLDPEGERPPNGTGDKPSFTWAADGGLVKIKNVLPEKVARELHSILEAIPRETWTDTNDTDYSRNVGVEHAFFSTKKHKDLELIFRTMEFLAPLADPDAADRESATSEEADERLPCTLSAALYTSQPDLPQHRIKPHDDRAYHDVLIGEQLVLHSRSVAMILYLSPDWQKEYGGLLLDHEDLDDNGKPKEYVPEFNSMVAFRVPRWHEVTPVKEEGKKRFSIFGWALEPGMVYELEDGEAKLEATNGQAEVESERRVEESNEKDNGGQKTSDSARSNATKPSKSDKTREALPEPQSGKPEKRQPPDNGPEPRPKKRKPATTESIPKKQAQLPKKQPQLPKKQRKGQWKVEES